MQTYRQIYKWGDKRDSHLDAHTLEFLEEYFGTDRSRQQQIAESIRADDPVRIAPNNLASEHRQFFIQLLGEACVEQSDFSRASHALGKYYADLLHLRHGRVPFPPDVVLMPKSHQQVQQIVDYCSQHHLPIIPFGGGSSVTRALEAQRGGVSLDLQAHMHQVLELNTHNQTVRVQAGISGPQLESYLNERGYTCGHFPQSFEHSTVGGWIAARGAGQCSTGYGRAEDLMVALKVAMPIGTFESRDYPACAQAWDLNRLFAGSEGTLGVITEVTWRIFRYRPANQACGTFIFRDFESATEAMREIMQAEIGRPHLFRISDGPETWFGFKHQGFEGTWKDKFLRWKGYHPPARSTMMMTVEGDERFTRLVARRIRSIARKHGGLAAGKSPVHRWLKQRYTSSYLRDAFMDAGYMIDTMETAVTWDRLLPLWRALHKFFDETNRAVFGMSHISHVYPNGCNLYTIFMAPMKPMQPDEDIAEFLNLQQGILKTFVDHGGSISHHHGVGRMGGQFMHTQFDPTGLNMLNGIKRCLDPNGILNPGGTLSLDN